MSAAHDPHKPTGFSAAARTYVELGWAPFPLPAGQKSPPPEGVTGVDGVDPTPEQIERWIDTCDGANIGLRLPPDIIGIDIDHYDGKQGAETLAQLEAIYGPLPPTWRSTARGDSPSGIRFYRIPPGVIFPGQLGPGIDVIQHHHRYAVVAPSTHPITGQRYRWHDSHTQATRPPEHVVIVDLPTRWLDLQYHPPELADRPATRGIGATLLDDDSIAERIRIDHRWHDVLTGDGWRITQQSGNESKWVRPGKDPRGGISAVLHETDGPFVVFSTSVPELQQRWAENANGSGWSFSMFGYLAATRYRGDRGECARDYRRFVNATDAQLHTNATAPRAAATLAGDDDPVAAIGHLINWPIFWAKDRVDEEFVAYPLVPRGRAVALFAPAKAGKSTIVLALVAALATGRPLFGITPTPATDVLYLDYEMTESDLRERLIELGYDADVDLTRLHYALMPSLPPLDTRAGAEALDRLADSVDAQVVVVDTFGRAVEGDENEADTTRNFYRFTGMMLKAKGRAVLRTDHAGKDSTKGQRGSSAKNDDVDVVWSLRRTEFGVALTRTHSRMSWVPAEVELVRVDDGDTTRWMIGTKGAPTYPAGTAACVAAMDTLGIPLAAGYRPAGDLLNTPEHQARFGQKFRQKVIQAAIRARREVAAGQLHIDPTTSHFRPDAPRDAPSNDASPRTTTTHPDANGETAASDLQRTTQRTPTHPDGPTDDAVVSIGYDAAWARRSDDAPTAEDIEPV